MDLFRLRLNCVDHYQAAPLAFDPILSRTDGNPFAAPKARVPVIRAFGATETGQKVCAHIHGAFPYMYVPYEEGLSWDIGEYCPILRMRGRNLTSTSRCIHTTAPSLNRSCPCRQLSPECVRRDPPIRCTYFSCERRTFLWISCGLQAVPQGLSTQSTSYDSLGRSASTRCHHEKSHATS